MNYRLYDRKRIDIQEAERKGWVYAGRTGSSHLKFTHPRGGPTMVLPSTIGGGRADRNGVALVRRLTREVYA